jgi:predicted dehydrogenase
MRSIGLIGCGGIVQRTHALGYQALKGRVQIAALADPSAANRASAGALFGVPVEQRYEDYQAMLAAAPVDTVVIATPHSFHAEQAVAAATAGKAIISEKPMAVSLEEADAIRAAVERYGVPYTVVHNLLFSQAIRGAAYLLKEGGLGRPLIGRGEMMGNKNEKTTTIDNDWRASKRFGGGALIDSSYHEIYTVETLMGSPVKYVQARVATLKFPIDVDDTALMTFEHESGAASNVLAAWCVRGPAHAGRWVSVSGTRGAIRVVYSAKAPLAAFRDAPEGSNRWEEVDAGSLPGVAPAIEGDSTGHAAFLVAACDALASGGALPIALAQARHNLAIVEAAREASQSRRAVEVAA